ncbi:2-C-methyl-D-erythritol 4-phosphate cytidylyltransferase [soil metagenome]
MRVALVIVAAGSGSRVGAARDGVPVNKVLLGLGDSTVLGASVRTVLDLDRIHRLVVVVRPTEREQVADLLTPLLGAAEATLVDGGPTRHQSEWRALSVLADDIDAGEIDVVAIHDGARPLAPTQLYVDVLEAAVAHGGAVPVVELPGLVAADLRPVDAGVVAVQTPQAFRAAELLAAYRQAEVDGVEGTDTATTVAAHADLRIKAVLSTPRNLKVTWPEDLAAVERLRD